MLLGELIFGIYDIRVTKKHAVERRGQSPCQNEV